jgi:hypothetical protein
VLLLWKFPNSQVRNVKKWGFSMKFFNAYCNISSEMDELNTFVRACGRADSLSNFSYKHLYLHCKILIYAWHFARRKQPWRHVKGLQSLNMINDCAKCGFNSSLALILCLQPEQMNIIRMCFRFVEQDKKNTPNLRKRNPNSKSSIAIVKYCTNT